MSFDIDNDTDTGTDPYFIDSNLIENEVPPVFSYIEIFHGEDWMNPDDGEESFVCIITFDGAVFITTEGPPIRRNLQGFNLDDTFKFSVIGLKSNFLFKYYVKK